MQHCVPIYPSPCIRYEKDCGHQLQEFIEANAGNVSRFDADGTAHFINVIKGERSPIFIKPGYWLRVVGPGQFSVCSDSSFRLTYRIVEE